MAYRSNVTFGYGLTPWVKRLIIANVAVFLVDFVVPHLGLTRYMAFVPGNILFQPWTLLTYMFAHGGFMHLFFNMLGLFFFGPPLENRWGSREFVKFYFLCGLGGALLSFVFAFSSPIIGASAAVYGVMLAFAMNWPDAPIYIWGIIPVTAKWLVVIIAVFSFVSAFHGAADNVAHFAHLGGFAAGFLYLKWERLRRTRIRRKFSPQLRAVPERKDAEPPVAVHPLERYANKEKLLDELDRVLDKISTDGMSSLTADERKLLDDVSRKYRQN
jgi:membrane associated rhomboid family serine protease